MKTLIKINNKLKSPSTIMSNARAIAKFLLEIYKNTTQDCSMIAGLVSYPFISKLNANSLSEELITFSIKQLFSLSMFEDVLIIELLYTLRITPETIFLLDFNCIHKDGLITYFDVNHLTLKNSMVPPSMLNNIKFYQSYIKIKGNKKQKELRVSKSKLIICGDFLICQTPKTIYNRFRNQFGVKLIWFKYPPKLIINLSLITIQIKMQI